ncbi:MAG: hypothetical protein HY847_00230 [Betaproteobacteria bacterium]|nr:hypothetical protein [Betaproteobacteria bacterium]
MRVPIIFLAGYGRENRVFLDARKLWSLYTAIDSTVNKHYFVISNLALEPGEIFFRDGDLNVGVAAELKTKLAEDSTRFEVTGSWSVVENRIILERNIRAFEYILESNPGPFWLFASSVTSMIGFDRLANLIADWPCRNTYGGKIEFIQLPDGKYMTFPSGSGILYSRDMVELIVSRSRQYSHDLASDVWLGLTLLDQTRTPLFRFDVTDVPDKSDNYFSQQQAKIHAAVRAGHFHLRVKTSGNSALAPDRYKTDVNLLVEAMQAFSTIREVNQSTCGMWENECARYSVAGSTSIPAIVDLPRP